MLQLCSELGQAEHILAFLKHCSVPQNIQTAGVSETTAPSTWVSACYP